MIKINTQTSEDGSSSVISAMQTKTEQTGDKFSTGTSDMIATSDGSGGSGGGTGGDSSVGGGANSVSSAAPAPQQKAASSVAATNSMAAQIQHAPATSGQKDKNENSTAADVIIAGKDQPITKTNKLVPSVTVDDVVGGGSAADEEKKTKPVSDNQIATTPPSPSQTKKKPKPSVQPAQQQVTQQATNKKKGKQNKKSKQNKKDENKGTQLFTSGGLTDAGKDLLKQQNKHAQQQQKQTQPAKETRAAQKPPAKPAGRRGFASQRNNGTINPNDVEQANKPTEPAAEEVNSDVPQVDSEEVEAAANGTLGAEEKIEQEKWEKYNNVSSDEKAARQAKIDAMAAYTTKFSRLRNKYLKGRLSFARYAKKLAALRQDYQDKLDAAELRAVYGEEKAHVIEQTNTDDASRNRSILEESGLFTKEEIEELLRPKATDDISEEIREAAAEEIEEEGDIAIAAKEAASGQSEPLPEDSIGNIVNEAEQAYYEEESVEARSAAEQEYYSEKEALARDETKRAQEQGSRSKPRKKQPAIYSLYRDEEKDPYGQDTAIKARVSPATDEKGNQIIDPAVWDVEVAAEAERYHAKLEARRKSRFYNFLTNCFPVVFDKEREKEYADTPDLAEFKYRSAKSRAHTLDMLNTPTSLKISGDRWEEEIDEDGKPTGWYIKVHSPRVQTAIDRLIKGTDNAPGYHCTEAEALRLIMLAGGIGVDNHGKIFDVDAADFELQEGDVLKIVSQIRNSQAVYGHPLGYTGDLVVIHNTRCYPCGYVDTQMLDSLTAHEDSVLHGVNLYEIRRDVRRFWCEKTHPLLLQDSINGHADQRFCVENMVRACMESDEREDFYNWQIHNNDEDATYLEGAQKIFADNISRYCDEKPNADAADFAYAKAAHDAAEVARQAREDLLDANERRASANQFTKAFSWFTSLGRRMAVLNPVLMIGGFVENLKGQGNTFVSNKMITGMLCSELGETLPEASAEEVKDILQQFIPNDFIKAFASTDEAVYAIKAAYVVFETFGTDAVRLFAIEMMEQNVTTVTAKEAIAWCEKYSEMKKAELKTGAKQIDKEQLSKSLRALDSATQRFADKILTGGGITDSIQAVRFFNIFLMNMGLKFAADPVQPGIHTTESLEKAIRVQGGTKTILNMMVEPQASSAMLQTVQLTMNGHSPLEEMAKQFLREHQITDGMFAWSIDFFLRYGLRQVILYFPMSTTVNFLIAQGILKHKGVTIENSPNGIQSLNSLLGKYEKAAIRGQMGIDQAYGLKMCILTDLVQTGSHLMMAGMVFLLHVIFDAFSDDGDDDEPDELQKGRPEEWSFGGLFKVVPAWWCYDMIGSAYAIGTSAWVYFSGKGTANDAVNVLANGIGDSLNGTACFDAIETISDMIKGSVVLYNKATNPDYKVPDEWVDKWTNNTFQIMNRLMVAAINDKPINSRQFVEQSVATFMKKMTPGFLNNMSRESVIFGNEQRDRSPSYIYTGTDYSDTTYINKEDGQGAEDEKMRRSLAKNNILYAAFLDMFRGINSNEYNKYTGYQFWEQPVATLTDAIGKAWLEEFDVPDQYSVEWQALAKQRLGENASDEEIDQAVSMIKKESASQLLETLEGFNTVDDAKSVGFVMNNNARQNLKLYLEGLIIATENDYVNTWGSRNDYWGSQFANIDKKEQIAIYKDLLNKWVYNTDIPTTAAKYEKLVSDTQTNYIRSDGTVTNAFEALFNPDVQAVKKQMGNAPSSMLPWTLIENKDSYNDETKVAWYNDYTHNEGTTNDNISILETLMAKHPEITEGVNKGELILPKISGSQDPNNRDLSAEQRIDWKSGESPTIDDRRYVYKEGSYDVVEKTSEEEYKEAAALFGINYDEYKQKRNDLYSGKTAKENKESSGGNYSYSRGGNSYSYSRSGGSGGGSSYSPKIYSYDSRLYTNKASGINTHSPYKASSTYLRPGFSTKGSREAYKRSDI